MVDFIPIRYKVLIIFVTPNLFGELIFLSLFTPYHDPWLLIVYKVMLVNKISNMHEVEMDKNLIL